MEMLDCDRIRVLRKTGRRILSYSIFASIFLIVSMPQLSFAEQLTPNLAYDWNTHTGKGNEVLVNVLDTESLNVLEETGFSISEQLGGTKKESQTAELFKSNALYRSFVNSIGQPLLHDKKTDQLPETIAPNYGDIAEMVRLIRNFEDKGKRSDKDLAGGYFIRHLSNNSQYPYTIEYDGDEPRHFDYRWLNSKFGYLKLIAVVNRLDRVDFNPNSCGEVRFIYRLSYQSPKSNSSMPFLVNIVKQYPKAENCARFAKNWLLSAEQSKSFREAGSNASKKFGEFVRNNILTNLSFKQLEVNFQSLRFTSGYMHDFGGQAMYIQRIFRTKDGKLEPMELENTPDVLAVEKKPELLKKFIEYLKSGDHLEKLDQGVLNIDFDSTFLAKQAVSWSTLGRARTANKPYSRLFQNKTELLNSIDISKLKFIKSHEALVERLNNLTCMGCHQSSGTAGFHMLGFADNKFSHGFNRQELPFSPHVFAESFRREAYTSALANGKTPNVFRPLSNFPKARWHETAGVPSFDSMGIGQMCLISQTHFSKGPSCETDTICKKTVTSKGIDVLFGECIREKQALAGSACWQGEITENQSLPIDRGPIPTYNFFAFQDKWQLKGSLPSAQGYKCVLPQSGAPLGRSSRSCSADEENFTKIKLDKGAIPTEICANQGGNGFDLCAATGDSGACLEARVVRSMLDTCYPGHFCREDYICQKFPEYNNISEAHYSTKKDGKRINQSSPSKISGEFIKTAQSNHVGFCVPTYFLFNMRLDGHPSPMTGLPPGEPKIDRTQPLRGYKK